MSKNKRIPFPTFLNAKQLIIRWEYDVVLAGAGVGVIASIGLTILSINPLIAMFLGAIIGYFSFKNYVKFFKKTRRNFLTHLMYSNGFKRPLPLKEGRKPYEDRLVPYGFETKFIG